MFNFLIQQSIRHKLVVFVILIFMIGSGIWSLVHLPIDAVPDITDNQVQIISSSPDLSAQEVEKLITYPLELELANIPRVKQIRSISRFGLSVITVVFDDNADIYWAREQINQKISGNKDIVDPEIANPEMGPITTGLGEIYQYVVYVDAKHTSKFDATELRSIQDWIIKRQLTGIPGVIAVNSSGGFLKEYEIAVDPEKLQAFGLSVSELIHAVERNNSNAGGSYIEKENQTYFIRAEGVLETEEEIGLISVKIDQGVPILMKDVAEIRIGHAPRFGAMTMNGRDEVVGGQVLMLKGSNSQEVVHAVRQRISEIAKTLPEGIVIEPYLDRSKLVDNTTRTVGKNLIEGALVVILVLVLLLGNLRAGLLVASIIPLSMLFALSMMRCFGVSANLMSLGAIDFGLIVDGAVIVVEAILFRLGQIGNNLSRTERESEIREAALSIRNSAAFGEIIILIVYLPILLLGGIEGKMFIPMAQTVSFAILGALLLSLTYVPLMSSLILKAPVGKSHALSEKIFDRIYQLYAPLRDWGLAHKSIVLTISFLLFLGSLYRFSLMGSEFIPTLEEGDFALHQILPPGSSIMKGVEVSHELQDILMNKFPEVEKVVTKIGTAEIPTDIMPLEAGDIYVIMKDKDEWVSAHTREEMFEKMEEELNKFPGVIYEFTQPIQMRFNELMTGVRQDIAIKIYGDNLGVLASKAIELEKIVKQIKGVSDVRVESTTGLQQMQVDYDRSKIAKYGIDIAEMNELVKTAFAGTKAGYIYKGEQKHDIVVRLHPEKRKGIESLKSLKIKSGESYIPLSELANIRYEEGPSQISRDDTKRRITLGINVLNRDIVSVIEDIKQAIDTNLALPAGYYIRYGGQFENYENARNRLLIAVPAALLLIFLMLFLSFRSVLQTLIIFIAIPFSAIGGIWALSLRGLPFSISAGIGFIALFGVAVLNGIVLISYFNQLKKNGMTDTMEIIKKATRIRLRPVIATAAVASLGFLPMALSHSPGAEVQRPLATVVIGGLISATILTLLVLPVIYALVEKWRSLRAPSIVGTISLLFLVNFSLRAQNDSGIARIEKVLSTEPHLIKDLYSQRIALLRDYQSNQLQPNPWSISYSAEEFKAGSDAGIHSLNLSHYFIRPNLRNAYKENVLSEIPKIEISREMEIQKIRELAISVYLKACYYHSLKTEAEIFKSVLSEELFRNEVKFSSGESGALNLEKTKIEIFEIEKNLLRYKLIEQEYLSSLSQFLNSEFITAESLDSLNLVYSDRLEEIPLQVQLQEAEKESIRRSQAYMLEKIKPQIFAGFSLQNVNSNFLYLGYQIGVNIQFSDKYKENIKNSSQLSTNIIEKDIEWLREKTKMQVSQLLTEINKNELKTSDLEIQISSMEKLLNQYRIAYLSGEVSFLEYSTLRRDNYQLKKDRLEAVFAKYILTNQLNHIQVR